MPPEKQSDFDPTDHLLPAHKSSPVGPTVGTVIILVLLIIGAFYFWGASLNRTNLNDNLPLIPADNSTTTVQ